MLANPIGVPRLRELAEQQAQLEGEISLDSMPRLAALQHAEAPADRALVVSVRFGFSAAERLQIACVVTGELLLECRRCLGPVSWPLETDFSLELVRNNAELEALDSRFDAIALQDNELQLAAVVEDEVLAGLPLAPAHESSGLCGPVLNALLDADESHARDTPDIQKQNRPFAGLDQLIRSGSATEGKGKA